MGRVPSCPLRLRQGEDYYLVTTLARGSGDASDRNGYLLRRWQEYLMNPYLEAAMQCYAKAGAHLKREVLPKMTDTQVRQGIQFPIEHAEQEVKQLQEAGNLLDEGKAD